MVEVEVETNTLTVIVIILGTIMVCLGIYAMIYHLQDGEMFWEEQADLFEEGFKEMEKQNNRNSVRVCRIFNDSSADCSNGAINPNVIEIYGDCRFEFKFDEDGSVSSGSTHQEDLE